MNEDDRIDWMSLAILIVSVHYGLAFLLGTGQEAFKSGLGGSLYGVSTAMGVILLGAIAPVYLKHRSKRFWEFFSDRFGNNLGNIIRMMSWTWMLGVVASQASAIGLLLGLEGIWMALAASIVTSCIAALCEVPIQYLGKLLKVLLIITTVFIFGAVVALGGLSVYISAPLGFPEAVEPIPSPRVAAVVLATVLITATGMDFHDYIRRAKSVKSARLACGFAALVLFLLAFLPSSLVLAVEALPDVSFEDVDERQKIRAIIQTIASRFPWVPQFAFVLPVIPLAIGPGAAVLRVMRNTAVSTGSPATYKYIHHGIVICTVTALCATGATIIDLLVEFYAVYIAAIVVPLIAFVSEGLRICTYRSPDIVFSAAAGAFVGLGILFATAFEVLPIPKDFSAAVILVAGSTAAVMILAIASKTRIKES